MSINLRAESKLKRAITFLVISLGCYIVMGILPVIFLPDKLANILFILATALVYAFIIWQIKLKQNWARILAVLMFILALFGTVSNLSDINSNFADALSFYNDSHVLLWGVNILNILERVLEAIAICFLFNKETNILFKKQK